MVSGNAMLVAQISELENLGLVRMMKSADDGSISVAITTDGFKKMTELDWTWKARFR